MDGIKSSLDDIEMSLKRLASAVDALELAADRRMRHDEARATEQEEYALMQDDRSRRVCTPSSWRPTGACVTTKRAQPSRKNTR